MQSIFFQNLCVLLTAHLLGDFLLPAGIWLKKKKFSAGRAVIHSLVHALLAYLLSGLWTNWLLPLMVFASHVIIDLVKSRSKKESLISFLVSQFVHLVLIVLIAAFFLSSAGFLPYWIDVFPRAASNLMILLSGVLLMTQAGGILIGYFVRPFQEQIRINLLPEKRGLLEGGKTIGFLERLLIFVFVLTGQFAGVGFLIAAKSIFRFGELKDSENRKEAEYILIGTFASFLFALVVSLLIRRALEF